MPAKSKLNGFEFYKKESRRGSTEPLATITKSGTFTLNPPALKQLKVDPKHIQFLFNSNEFSLGVLFIPEQNEDSYKVRFSRSGTMQVSAAPVLKRFGVEHDERRVYTPHVEDDDFVVISLKAT